jgi:predicted glycosyltransferase
VLTVGQGEVEMRIVFDIVHPAHVHFFKNMIWSLEKRGHQTTILARDKEVTCRLLDDLGFRYKTVGRPSTRGKLGQLAELVHRDLTLVRLIRAFEADVIVTRNPAGVQAAQLLGIPGIFDTDDGSAAGVHFKAALPFAHFLTTPDCLPEYWGKKHWRYPGYKHSAYLHTEFFTPDRAVREELGVSEDEKYFIVRFVAMNASHDGGESGMSLQAKGAVIERLQKHGSVCPRKSEHWRRARSATALGRQRSSSHCRHLC